MKQQAKTGSLARLNNARAEKFELENLLSRRRLIHVDDVKVYWFDIAETIKSRFAALPTLLSRRLAAITQPEEIEAVLSDEIAAIMCDIAACGERIVADYLAAVEPSADVDDEEVVVVVAAAAAQKELSGGADKAPPPAAVGAKKGKKSAAPRALKKPVSTGKDLKKDLTKAVEDFFSSSDDDDLDGDIFCKIS